MAKKSKKSSSATPRATGKSASGKHLVIVESPTKAKTINKYLGSDFVVMASVGHVRDLPSRNPKGVKAPVPGVDLEHDFAPTYEVLPGKQKTVTELRKAAKTASDIWFATDLDREGEAIAWHLAQALSVDETTAKRVVFNAITKDEIRRAFDKPRPIDLAKVDAQQARRILDRIVGYQVSPFLWKKVAGGLSAGRVQSVAVRIVVEREREIDAFTPEEIWKLTAILATDPRQQTGLIPAWQSFIQQRDDKDKGPTLAQQNGWLSEHACLRAELVSFNGEPFKPDDRAHALRIASALGFQRDDTQATTDPKAKGPAKNLCTYLGHVAPGSHPPYAVVSTTTRQTTTRPPPPFITSTLQQTAANRLGFGLQRTMRIAQQLYEGVDIHGSEGQTGLITYMRTDSTHLSGEALAMARGHIEREYGPDYLPEKPNFFKSSNKSAQEAHEAIRPTHVHITPKRVRKDLTEDQFKLYRLIWERFVACQMTPAKWESTALEIQANTDLGTALFKASGRRLLFDGFYKVIGLPQDDIILPHLPDGSTLAPVDLNPVQTFTSPPPRYTEGSLQKKLEEEGIGRPSTYAAIIQTIQDRKYVEPVAPRDKRLRATDLGMVVTDMLTAAFPTILDIAYTREMEGRLDEIEESRLNWVQMLHQFYGPFKDRLKTAHDEFTHAKAAMEPAPHACAKCGSPTVYRFGRNGKFLSCSTYPACDYAAPIDREGNPMEPELTDILCPEDNEPMIRRNGRFGPFLAARTYPAVKFILKLDPKKGHVILPKTPPMLSGIPCPKCNAAELFVRDSKRGLWLSCSSFPKCRGRVAFNTLEAPKQQELEAAWAKHLKEHPTPVIRTTDGHVIREDEHYLPKIAGQEASPEADVAIDAA